MIVILGEGLAQRPPLKAADKYLRSQLIKAGINPGKVRFNDPSDGVGDAIYVLALGARSIRSCSASEEPGRLHKHHIYGARVLVYGTYHPAYVLRRRGLQASFRNDLAVFSAMVEIDAPGKERSLGSGPAEASSDSPESVSD